MITKAKKVISAVALGSAVALMASPAFADGFLGGIINNVAPGLGTTLDLVNSQLGRPFEAAVALGVDKVVPGSGEVLTGMWAIQNSGALTPPNVNGGQVLPPPQAMLQPLAMPITPQLGNFCATSAGRFGPGPFNPVGMPCQAMSPFGLIAGYVTQ